MSRSIKNTRRGGFSLIELVIVVVIIGIIAAIAIPRMSRGTAGAGDSALSGNLAAMRNAVELYASEHGGVFPGNGAASDTIDKQLTQYTDVNGVASETRTTTAIYGPYLRSIPPIPVGPCKGNKDQNTLIKTGTVDTVDTTPAHGWLYNKSTGNIKANIPAATTDVSGKAYSDY